MSVRWKVLGVLALLVLVGWVFTAGLGHGGSGSSGTTTLELRSGP